MRRMTEFIIALALIGQHPLADAAVADRATLPPDVAQYTVYLSLIECPKEHREKLANVIRFVNPSLSSNVLLDDQLPAVVPNTDLLRVDLAGLSWESTYPSIVKQHYPYRPDLAHTKAVPLVVSGLWWAANVLDPIEMPDAQYLLLYKGKIPKNVDEHLAFFGIQNDQQFLFGLVEGQSGVSVQRIRLIENRPGSKRNVSWLTRDSRKVSGDHDPLETLPNKVKFDAQEVITQSVKWKGGESGVLQTYFLADSKGVRQDRAPADIVVDHVALRGVEIRNFASCVTCHISGINEPTSDEFRKYIESGARVSFLKKDEQRRTDQYLTSNVAKEIKACQEQYADGIALCNGLTPEENARAYMDIVRLYDSNVTLEQAGREAYMPAREVQLALADYSRRYTLTAPLALLAQGVPISRERWKANQSLFFQVKYQWLQQFAK